MEEEKPGSRLNEGKEDVAGGESVKNVVASFRFHQKPSPRSQELARNYGVQAHDNHNVCIAVFFVTRSSCVSPFLDSRTVAHAICAKPRGETLEIRVELRWPHYAGTLYFPKECVSQVARGLD